MRISEWISLAVMSALAACTSPVETITNVNPKVDISVYKSFSWISDKPLVSHIPDGQPFNPVIETRIKSAIVEGFQSKGYAMVDNSAEADFVVAFTVGTRDKIRLITVPAPYHHYYRRGPGFRAYYYGAPAVSAYTYTEGVLAVDVFDVKTKQPTWHGYSTKLITLSDKKNPGPVIREIVTSTLAAFPSRAKAIDTSSKIR